MVGSAGVVATAEECQCENTPSEEKSAADEPGEVAAVEHLEQVPKQGRNDDDGDVATDGVTLVCMVAHGLALS